MNQQRDPSIYLAADVTRCDPSQDCKRRSECARYMAALPAFGGSMMDACSTAGLGCLYFIPITRRAPAPIQAPRKVHPPVGARG